jgi:hypothetical protein
MALRTPGFIVAAGIDDDRLIYEWDEWRMRRYYDRDPQGLKDRLEVLSLRALVGVAIACGEWVVFRMSKVDSDPRPGQFLEAAWAGLVHHGYCRYIENDDEEWRSPARGPLDMTMSIVNDALFHLNEDPDAALRAVWMHSLATHVLPRRDAFDAWFAAVLPRLIQDHGRPGDDQQDLFSHSPPGMGSPVPRELFDPSLPYDPAQDAAHLDAFLRQLDPKSNPFLGEPAEVAQWDDFEGTPYRYP